MNETTRNGIKAKLDRADQHLEALADEVRIWGEGVPPPHTYWPDVDYDTGCYGIRISIKTPPPIMLSVTCGDLVHCLRSALDHLVCGMVEKPTKRTAFPLYSDRDDFFCRVELPARRKERGPLTGLGTGGILFAMVEQVQPYNGPHRLRDHPLYLPADLSNTDKHRAILARAAAHKRLTEVNMPSFTGRDIEYVGKAEYIVGKPLEDGAEFIKGQFKVPGPNPQVQVAGQFPLDIGFGQFLVTIEGLQEIRKVVRGTVEQGLTLLAAS